MTRFAKGQSGNPKGRPRKAQEPRVSAFDVIMDKTLTVTQGGRTRELTLEEALQHKTYEEALAGNRPARRAVLKMIAKREMSLASRNPPRSTVTMSREIDPENANEALLILGITSRDPRDFGRKDTDDRFLLEPWAVEAAMRRSARRKLSEKDLTDIRRSTRDADSLKWPPATPA